ncbi:MAG: aminotransferase class I/II-fold pyridoxal phosphate-dependent enzyme [Dehalococcoidia bacterium]|nr:aminotransferase class I/II-fold pyridoxal phosphate-dependent enzyme [Dehalococcoidia bacterium]
MADPASPTRSRFLSQKVAQIPPSGIRRFFDLLASMDDVISLGVGEPDFTTPWHIREAGIYSLEKGHTSYTSNYGMLDLRYELSRHLERRYGLDYDPRTELMITVGVSEALDLAMRAILNPGDEVIVPDPTYVSYVPCTVLAGGTPVAVPTRREEDFQLAPAELAARITPRTKAIVLAYPNNPTGAVIDRGRLEEISRLVESHDLLVLSDEIYDRLVYGAEHVCFATLPGMRDRTILLGGMSKAYAMTGWRVGYAAAPQDILEAMVKVHQYTIMCAPTAGQYAALEALKEGEADILEMVEEYDRRRRVIVAGLRQMGLDCFEPRGAFYAFPSIRSTGLSSEEFAERLLVEEKVAVVPGNAFGDCGEGHVRCCYATSMDNIDRALERIGRFVERISR